MIVNEDCLDGMTSVENDSVSLILTDPPYGFHKMGEEWDLAEIDRRTAKGVVSHMPAGQVFDRRQSAKLYSFLLEASVKFVRVLKPSGFALVFAAPRLSHRVAAALEDAGLEIRDLLAWRRPGQAKAFKMDHLVKRRGLSPGEEEKILTAISGRKTPQLRPDFESIILARKPCPSGFIDGYVNGGVGLIDPSNPVLGDGGFPSTVIEAPRSRREGFHSPKPVALLRHLIRIFGGEPGGLVLDAFAGRGSVGEAALAEGYRFLGFEKDPEAAEAANRRLS